VTLRTALIPTLLRTMNTNVSTVLETMFGMLLHRLVNLAIFTLKDVISVERMLMEMLNAWFVKTQSEILTTSLISQLKTD